MLFEVKALYLAVENNFSFLEAQKNSFGRNVYVDERSFERVIDYSGNGGFRLTSWKKPININRMKAN